MQRNETFQKKQALGSIEGAFDSPRAAEAFSAKLKGFYLSLPTF